MVPHRDTIVYAHILVYMYTPSTNYRTRCVVIFFAKIRQNILFKDNMTREAIK